MQFRGSLDRTRTVWSAILEAEVTVKVPKNPIRKVLEKLLKDCACQNLQLTREFVGELQRCDWDRENDAVQYIGLRLQCNIAHYGVQLSSLIGDRP